MRQRTFKQKVFLSNKGSLTLQFLLGFILCLGFIMFFAVMSFTIIATSITQYITYASARQLFLGMQEKEEQIENAKKKYAMLAHGSHGAQESFKGLFNPTGQGFSFALFEVNRPENLSVGSIAGEGGRFNNKKFFYGVYTTFIPKVLEIKTLFGATVGPFKTGIGSYLGREPSTRECENFNQKRGRAVAGNGFNTVSANIFESAYNPVEDNGC